MEISTLKCTAVSSENFSEYGQLISSIEKTSNFSSGEFNFWNRLGEMHLTEKASICIVESFGAGGLKSKFLERHQRGSETLIPTGDIIIVVALPGNEENTKPNLETVKAYKIKKGDAVILAQNVWHYAPLTEEKSVKTFVVFNTNTPEEDNLKIDLEETFNITYIVEA